MLDQKVIEYDIGDYAGVAPALSREQWPKVLDWSELIGGPVHEPMILNSKQYFLRQTTYQQFIWLKVTH